MDRIYKVKEAAEKLRVHPMTVYSLIQRRELEAIRIGKTRGLRITEKALSDVIKRKTLAITENERYHAAYRISEGEGSSDKLYIDEIRTKEPKDPEEWMERLLQIILNSEFRHVSQTEGECN